MRRPVHRVFVEERLDDLGQPYFVAGCLETFAQCDSYSWPVWGPGPEHELEAIDQAVMYLAWGQIHDPSSPHFCDAEHVL